MAATAVLHGFVGREDELRALDEARLRVLSGEPTTVVLGGEAGVGKTRLAAQLARRLCDDGWRVLEAPCVELGAEGLPFAPLTAALRQLVREEGADGLLDRLPPRAGELVRLLPDLELRDADPAGAVARREEEGGDVGRGRLFELVLLLLERLAAESPVLLLVEDLHWADRSTRELIAYLVRTLREAPVMLLLTHRTDELHRGHPLRPFLAELERQRGTRRVDVERFDRRETALLVRETVGADVPPRVVDSIFERSEGNAFFVEALASCPDRTGLSETLRDLLLLQVERLEPATQQLLRTASAAGQRFGHELLAAVADLEDGPLTTALREAVTAQVLLPAADGRGYAFRHALVREAVHDDLLPGEHTRLHARFASAIEERPQLVGLERAPAEVAHHWFAAHDNARALRAAARAADDAAGRLAHAEEQRHLERVLLLWDQVPEAGQLARADRLAVLQRAAGAAQSAGELDRAVDLVSAALDEVDETSDPHLAARLLELRSRCRRSLGRAGGRRDLLRALELLPASPSPERARVLASLGTMHMLEPDLDAAQQVLEEARRVATEVGERDAEISASISLAPVLVAQGRAEEGLALVRQARDVASADNRLVLLTRCHTNLSDLLEGLGRHEEAVQAAADGVALSRRLGLGRTHGAFLTGNLVESLSSLGRWDEAARLALEDLELDPPGSNRFCLHGRLADIFLARGQVEEAAHHLGAAQRLQEQLALGTQFVVPASVTAATLRQALGDRPGAVEALLAALHREPARDVDRYLWPLLSVAASLGADLAERRRVGGDDGVDLPALRQAVDEVAARVVPRLAVAGPLAAAHAATFDAELARWSSTSTSTARSASGRGAVRASSGDDRAAWDAVAAAWEELGQPYRRAQALHRAAERAAAEGDRTGAAQRLRTAGRLADALGAVPLRRAIDALAAAARLPAEPDAAPVPQQRHDAPQPALGLTPRELAVLRLVAAGRSNRQIAEELYISAKTASVHVSNILAKLGVGGRGEAAAAAHRLRLFEEP